VVRGVVAGWVAGWVAKWVAGCVAKWVAKWVAGRWVVTDLPKDALGRDGDGVAGGGDNVGALTIDELLASGGEMSEWVVASPVGGAGWNLGRARGGIDLVERGDQGGTAHTWMRPAGGTREEVRGAWRIRARPNLSMARVRRE
jgi:hypothetical protein